MSSGDCYAQLESMLENLNEDRKRMAPAFVFVDPYGFKVPGQLLARLAAAGRVELFVNVIWRELDMAMAQGQTGGMANTLNEVFGNESWRGIERTLSFDERADKTVDLLRETYGTRWVTSIRMMGWREKEGSRTIA